MLTTENTGARTTEPFRNEHAGIREHLGQLAAMIGSLPGSPQPKQRETMQRTVSFLDSHVKPHAEWEDQVLYPVMDHYAGSTAAHPFTATMRHEHKIIARWIDELARLASASAPDVIGFVRQADQLLGLISAHLENEDQVLLPILDAHMTPEVFLKELMRGHH